MVRNKYPINVTNDRQPILDSICRMIHEIPTIAAVELLPLVSTMRASRRTPVTHKSVARAVDRWRLLNRFGELRQDPTHDALSDRQLLATVLAESPTITPNLTVSMRSLQRWLRRYRGPQANGLPGGLPSLLDHYGQTTHSHSN